MRSNSAPAHRPNPPTPTEGRALQQGRVLFFHLVPKEAAPMLAAPMTELEAVNDMLVGIGQLPVNAIIPEIVDQSIALAELHKVVREVCAYGFKFNTDEDYVLTPDIDGFVAIP